MSLKYELKTVELSSGDKITFNSDNITLIVGPNNSGKSTFLREILNSIEKGKDATASIRRVINDIETNLEGNESEFLEFLHNNTQEYINESGQKHFRALNLNVHDVTAINRWKTLIVGYMKLQG